MQVGVALYGAARVIVDQPLVDVTFDTPTITLGQVLEKLIAAYPRVRPYILDEAGMLQFSIRVLINGVRPDPDATLATMLHHGDRLTLLVAVAGGEPGHPHQGDDEGPCWLVLLLIFCYTWCGGNCPVTSHRPSAVVACQSQVVSASGKEVHSARGCGARA